ncbi:tctex1 domain-containing protein 1-A [Scleropages formosus]|uniref:tctex1 domain-containing protein 1-A n=1 Tax=Scleropages formosus TaxID=113540 RepID=UPI000878AE6B|nr:tctex1 domain-containing protein 1-A-like [Scleropages formosus]
MTTHHASLSHDPVDQFGETLRSEQGVQLKSRGAKDLRKPRPPPLVVKGAELSRRNSMLSVNLSSPFLRRESLTITKHPSPGAWVHSSRLSFSGLPIHQPPREIRLENTYKTGPDDSCRFDANHIQRILQSALDGFLGDALYSAAAGGQLSRTLSERLRSQIRDISLPRYKLISFVVVGQCSNHDLQVASRCLWDTQTDSSAVAVFQNSSLFAVAIIYGVYFE